MIQLPRRHLLLGASAMFLAGCEKPLATATAASKYFDYHQILLRGVNATKDARDEVMPAALLAENNAHRQAVNLSPLLPHPELSLAALAHLADMHRGEFFEHNTPDGFTPNERAGLFCRSLLGAFGENLAWIEDHRRAPTARDFFEKWRGSPGHNANMLKAHYTHAGYAALRFGGKTYAAAVFGQVVSQLKTPMPFKMTGRDLGPSLSGASPRIADFVVEDPTRGTYNQLYPVSGGGPKLLPGAWRLRPLSAKSGEGLRILWGPLFIAEG